MDIKSLLAMAKQMGIGQDKINQVMQMSSKYGNDINGLRQAINEHGGVSLLDKALKATQNPLVRMGLKKIGITPEVIEGVKRDLGYGGVTTPTQSNDILSRLKNLK